MNFNQAEEEYIDGEDTIGLGTLGKEGSGRYVSCTGCSCIRWLHVYWLIRDESLVYFCAIVTLSLAVAT